MCCVVTDTIGAANDADIVDFLGAVMDVQRMISVLATPVARKYAISDRALGIIFLVHAGLDRPGLLHAITVGFASAGVDVHSARVRTVKGEAVDRFEVTDRNGRKLGEPAKRAVIEAVTGGVRTGRRGRLLRRR